MSKLAVSLLTLYSAPYINWDLYDLNAVIKQ